VALIVYVTVRGGVGVFSGDFSFDQKGVGPALAAFAMASVAGFSSHQVFRWLDAQANKLLAVTDGGQTVVPDLTGKTFDQAKAALKRWKLTVGEVTGDRDDKVQSQAPAPGAVVAEADAVDLGFTGKTVLGRLIDRR
jgi:hypothetical protein